MIGSSNRSVQWVAIAALACAGCSDGASQGPIAGTASVIDVHLGEVVDADGQGAFTVDVPLDGTVNIHLDGEARVVEIDAASPTPLATRLSSDAGSEDGAVYDGGNWLRPRNVSSNVIVLELEGSAATTIYARGAPPPVAQRERSLVWIDPTVVDDPTVVGLARVMAAASSDGHGGVLFERWFRRFATTVHSERAGPAQLMDEVAAAQGPDASVWDLDALPFTVTAVHNRHDLAPRGGGCGELRVSLASTHPVYAPLHLIFLFRQEPAVDDVSPGGEAHCLGTARRWARLTALEGDAFRDAAADMLGQTLVNERFIIAESVELTVSPWEWRQWKPMTPDELDNPPLFQTVATPQLNQPGALRNDFLSWVSEQAAALSRRDVEIPPKFRAASAQAPPSAPLERLDLTGLDPATLASYPKLAQQIEIVGCPTCHTDDANFVHTTPQRTFSPFYDRELDARAARLDALLAGEALPTPPFGPLQPE